MTRAILNVLKRADALDPTTATLVRHSLGRYIVNTAGVRA